MIFKIMVSKIDYLSDLVRRLVTTDIYALKFLQFKSKTIVATSNLIRKYILMIIFFGDSNICYRQRFGLNLNVWEVN